MLQQFDLPRSQQLAQLRFPGLDGLLGCLAVLAPALGRDVHLVLLAGRIVKVVQLDVARDLVFLVRVRRGPFKLERDVVAAALLPAAEHDLRGEANSFVSFANEFRSNMSVPWRRRRIRRWSWP